MPQLSHVVIVVEENEDYSTIVGNPSMPFFNSLSSQYGLATNYFADAHFSIGNYFMLTTGELVTADDGFTCAVTIDNVVRQLVANGKTWKVYAESLPAVGYSGGDVLPYAKHHNPFAYLRDVLNDLLAGRGRVVTLTGEAGLGKSRLLAEWHAEVGARVRWREGRAFAHTAGMAYGPFLDFIRHSERAKRHA